MCCRAIKTKYIGVAAIAYQCPLVGPCLCHNCPYNSVRLATDQSLSRGRRFKSTQTAFLNGPFPVPSFFVFIFSIQLKVINILYGWIRSRVLYRWKQPLCHNKCLLNVLLLLTVCSEEKRGRVFLP